MYQVLQVFTSLSFSLIDNFLSKSIKEGQALSRRRRLRVAETSPQSHGDVVATFPESPWFSAGVGHVAEKFSRCDVSEIYWRLAEVSKESQKISNMFDFTATPSRAAESPGDVAAMFPRTTGT